MTPKHGPEIIGQSVVFQKNNRVINIWTQILYLIMAMAFLKKTSDFSWSHDQQLLQNCIYTLDLTVLEISIFQSKLLVLFTLS